MRILNVITNLSHGGAQRLLIESVKRLAPMNELLVATLGRDGALEAELAKQCEIIHLGMAGGSFGRLRKLIASWKPDVVHSHLGHADWLSILATHGTEARRFMTLHNTGFKFDARDRLIFGIYRLLLSTIAKDYRVVAISKSVARCVKDQMRVKPEQIHLLYNAVAVEHPEGDRKECRRRLRLSPDAFIVLYLGRLARQKAVHTVIQAFASKELADKPAHLLVVGDGPRARQLIQKTQHLNLSRRVLFLPFTDRPYEYLKAADVIVLPSIREGLSLTMLESFHLGTPVIATNVEGPSEIIRHGESGLLFPPEDHMMLADLIRKLFDQPELRKYISKNALETVTSQFDMDQYVDSLVELYQETRSPGKLNSKWESW